MSGTDGIKVAAFYRFQRLRDLARLRDALEAACRRRNVLGLLLIAPEGVNGTLAGQPRVLDAALADIAAILETTALEPRESFAARAPFRRLKVRTKAEIVTMGESGVDPTERVGVNIDPGGWNALIADPEVVVIDARNAFEVAIGSFAGAVDPGVESFAAFPAWVRRSLDPARHRRVAMFCTGGIRCEKASSFMLQEGFGQVFQLRGGILNYLESIPEPLSLWRGGCFVFDERVAVGHGLRSLDVRLCPSCDGVVETSDHDSAGYEEGVSCPRCVMRLSEERKASARERQKQFELAAARGRSHLKPG